MRFRWTCNQQLLVFLHVLQNSSVHWIWEEIRVNTLVPHYRVRFHNYRGLEDTLFTGLLHREISQSRSCTTDRIKREVKTKSFTVMQQLLGQAESVGDVSCLKQRDVFKAVQSFDSHH